MNSSEIEFSAQFGGSDAADAVLPHFWALKAAARGVRLAGFPFPTLAFILRVDGEVTRYGVSEAGNIDIDKDGQYLSIDIEITCEDRERLSDVIASAILSSNKHIRPVAESKSWDVDFQAFQSCMTDLVTRYKDEITQKREHGQSQPLP